MVKKFGRFGEFLACANYPECKTTRELPKANAEAGEEAQTEAVQETCENCGRPMILKRGRFGQFIACTGYPDCKTTRKTQKDDKFVAPDVALEEHCPQCSSNLVIKQGRYGPFTACSNYPRCKYVKQETTGVSCPECGTGEIVEKKSKRGAFYSCSRYPACRCTMRDKPVPQSCPTCGARYVVEKTSEAGSRELQCSAQACEYKEALLARGADTEDSPS